MESNFREELIYLFEDAELIHTPDGRRVSLYEGFSGLSRRCPEAGGGTEQLDGPPTRFDGDTTSMNGCSTRRLPATSGILQH